MNITLSVDDKIVARARRVAQASGKSLNQVIRDYLEQLAGSDTVEAEVAELRALSLSGGGRLAGWRFDRDAVHERG